MEPLLRFIPLFDESTGEDVLESKMAVVWLCCAYLKGLI